MKTILLVLAVILFTGCVKTPKPFERFYIADINIKESAPDCVDNFQKKETPFFSLTDKNSTIGGILTFDGNYIRGFILVENKDEKFNELKEIFDCDTNNTLIKPSIIERSGKLESDLTAYLIKRCFYFK